MLIWVITPWRLVGKHPRFGDTHCLHLQENWYLPTMPQGVPKPADHHRYLHRRYSLKPHIIPLSAEPDQQYLHPTRRQSKVVNKLTSCSLPHEPKPKRRQPFTWQDSSALFVSQRQPQKIQDNKEYNENNIVYGESVGLGSCGSHHWIWV